MEKKMLFIYNPVSGRAQIKDALADIIETFSKDGFILTVCPTQKKGDCFEMLKKSASEYDTVSVCGGDGMLNEALNAIMPLPQESRPPIAFLPAGSTNDFASSVGLPVDLRKCAKKIASGKPFICDAGQFCEKYFAYIAAFGAFTSVAYDTSQDLKNMFGHFAYVVEGVRRLSEIKAYSMKITCEDKTIEGNFIYGMITNTMSVGGILKGNNMSKKMLHDGQFEVLLVRETKNALDLQAVLSGIITQNFSSDLFESFKTSQITLECGEPISWTLDGEYGGNIKRAKIENINNAFSVII